MLEEEKEGWGEGETTEGAATGARTTFSLKAGQRLLISSPLKEESILEKERKKERKYIVAPEEGSTLSNPRTWTKVPR